MNNHKIKLFALNSSMEFGKRVAEQLNIELSEHEERDFVDGEHKIRPLINVRNKHVYIISSLYTDKQLTVNDKLCRLLFFINALKDANATYVTVITPYLCYSRKDRKTKSGDPITTRYLAQIFEAVGTDHLVTIDVHNLQAFNNAYRCQTDHLEAKSIFIDYVLENFRDGELAVMSPDFGGVKRAEQFCEVLAKKMNQRIPLCYMEKKRSSGIVSGETIVGEVNNKNLILIDDLISSGGTMVRVAEACKERGAKAILALATHGIFVGGAKKLFDCELINEVITTNTITSPYMDYSKLSVKLKVLDVSALVAKAIDCFRSGDTLPETIGIE